MNTDFFFFICRELTVCCTFAESYCTWTLTDPCLPSPTHLYTIYHDILVAMSLWEEASIPVISICFIRCMQKQTKMFILLVSLWKASMPSRYIENKRRQQAPFVVDVKTFFVFLPIRNSLPVQTWVACSFAGENQIFAHFTVKLSEKIV